MARYLFLRMTHATRRTTGDHIAAPYELEIFFSVHLSCTEAGSWVGCTVECKVECRTKCTVEYGMECRVECRMECRVECRIECKVECRIECRVNTNSKRTVHHFLGSAHQQLCILRFQKTNKMPYGRGVQHVPSGKCLQSTSGDAPRRGDFVALRSGCELSWGASKRVFTFPDPGQTSFSPYD